MTIGPPAPRCQHCGLRASHGQAIAHVIGRDEGLYCADHLPDWLRPQLEKRCESWTPLTDEQLGRAAEYIAANPMSATRAAEWVENVLGVLVPSGLLEDDLYTHGSIQLCDGCETLGPFVDLDGIGVWCDPCALRLFGDENHQAVEP